LENIGKNFDPVDFAETFTKARVTSVNVFAKCHHGYAYYPTKVGEVHPGLSFDLLGAQISALHAAGIAAPIYISVLWDDLMGERHPEWVITTREGRTLMRRPLSNDSPNTGTIGWTTLDVATGYGDYLLQMVAELLGAYDVDGFWFDIVWAQPNFSPEGQRRMRTAGVRMDDASTVDAFFSDEINDFMAKMSGFIRARRPGAKIFYNCTVTPTLRDVVPFMTQIEVESLPTSGGQWGYPHFPQLARFARTFGVPVIGMTGRFHKSWADFGGLKTTDQLLYECGTIVSSGAGVSVGDQLDPEGRLDQAVYRTIGSAFEYLEAIEPWLVDSIPLAEIGVLGGAVASMRGERPTTVHEVEVEGIAQMLLELGVQFDILDPHAESFRSYRALVIPEQLVLDDQILATLADARDSGVRLILTGTAGLDAESGVFLIPDLPVTYVAPAPTVPSFMRLSAEQIVGELADDYSYAFYEQAHIVTPHVGSRANGELLSARFNRTWEHFTSHAQAPVGSSLDAPLVVATDQVLYFALPIFSAYLKHDYWVYRELFEKSLSDFLPDRLVRLHGPGWVEVTRHHQPPTSDRPARELVHLVTYQPRRVNNGGTPHVDQSARVSGLSFELAAGSATASRAYIAPTGEEVAIHTRDGMITVELPPLDRHTLVVVEWVANGR